MNVNKAILRQQWMRRYQEVFVRELPCDAGRICWDTAAFHYNEGHDPTVSALNTAKRLKQQYAAAPLNTF